MRTITHGIHLTTDIHILCTTYQIKTLNSLKKILYTYTLQMYTGTFIMTTYISSII